MSMNNYANHGYVVKVSDLAKFIPNAGRRAKFLTLVDEKANDMEALAEAVDKYLPPGFPAMGLMILNDECESDDLEIGVPYAMFDEADLFEMTPSKFHENLNKNGVRPTMSQWVTWG